MNISYSQHAMEAKRLKPVSDARNALMCKSHKLHTLHTSHAREWVALGVYLASLLATVLLTV